MHGKPEHTPPILQPAPPQEVALSQRDLHLSLTALFLLTASVPVGIWLYDPRLPPLPYAYFGVWFERMTLAHKNGIRKKNSKVSSWVFDGSEMRKAMTEVREQTWLSWAQEYERLHENLEEMLKSEEFAGHPEYQRPARMSKVIKEALKEKEGLEQ